MIIYKKSNYESEYDRREHYVEIFTKGVTIAESILKNSNITAYDFAVLGTLKGVLLTDPNDFYTKFKGANCYSECRF